MERQDMKVQPESTSTGEQTQVVGTWGARGTQPVPEPTLRAQKMSHPPQAGGSIAAVPGKTVS